MTKPFPKLVEERLDGHDNNINTINSSLVEIPNQVYITEKAKTVDVNNALSLKANTLDPQLMENKYRKKYAKENYKPFYSNNFSAGISDIEVNCTIGQDADTSLKLITDNGTAHTSVALIKSQLQCRSIEVTCNTAVAANMFRIAVGDSIDDFIFVNTTSLEVYRINGKVMTQIANTSSGGFTPVIGDRVKITMFPNMIQVFLNDVLKATIKLASVSQILPPKGNVKMGVNYRDTANTYKVSNIKIQPKLLDKYAHLSFDDVNDCLKDITTNAGIYTSIFNNAFLGFLKSIHDKYHTVFSLYLVYVNANDSTFDLSKVTLNFKNEFIANSDWLKLGFHGNDANSKYDDTTITPAKALTDYNNVITQIIRFASEFNIDRVTRTQYFTGGTLTLAQWKTAKYAPKGFLTADDNRIVNYYLNATQVDALTYCDTLYDSTQSIYFIKTDVRLENYADPIAELSRRLTDSTCYSNNDIQVIFTHEYMFNPTMQTNIDNVCNWLVTNGYVFDFPMNNIPNI